MIYIFGWSLMHVDWFYMNDGQTFVLVLKSMLHVEPVLWPLVEKNGPMEGMYKGFPQEVV